METGCQDIKATFSSRLKEIGQEIEEKKARIEALRLNTELEAQTLQMKTNELLALEEALDKMNLEILNHTLHGKRVTAKLLEKKKEFNEVKESLDKTKRKFEEEVSSLGFKHTQLEKMKTQLKDDTEKLERIFNKNQACKEEIIHIFKQQLMVSEGLGDEILKEKVIEEKMTETKKIGPSTTSIVFDFDN